MDIRIVSWNAQGLEAEKLDERSEGLIFHALFGQSAEQAALNQGEVGLPPDFIVLQEVVERSYNAHFRPHLEAIGYSCFPKQPHPERDYFEVIAVRPPWKIESSFVDKFDHSQMGRELLKVDAAWGQKRLRVMTAHMESLKSGSEARLAQMAEVGAAFVGTAPAIFVGDTNLRKSEWEAMREAFPAHDAFEMSGEPKAHRATWKTPDGMRQMRYDRAWLSKDKISLNTFEVRWEQSLSDHAGVWLEVQIEDES